MQAYPSSVQYQEGVVPMVFENIIFHVDDLDFKRSLNDDFMYILHTS